MTGASAPEQRRPALIERRIRKIANARSITLALAATFVGLAVGGAIAIRFLDETSFPTFGSAFWWALQTVTTVGYGDVTPEHVSGRIVGAFVMLYGIAFLTITIAAITSTFVARAEREQMAQAGDQARMDSHLHDLSARLERIEQSLGELAAGPRGKGPG